ADARAGDGALARVDDGAVVVERREQEDGDAANDLAAREVDTHRRVQQLGRVGQEAGRGDRGQQEVAGCGGGEVERAVVAGPYGQRALVGGERQLGAADAVARGPVDHATADRSARGVAGLD